MSDPYLGEIRLSSFGHAPKGWALCNGQLLAINTNQALFAILGTTYGGDGRSTFALPDLRGRSPVHSGNGVNLGDRLGEEAHTLSVNELPGHSHGLQASTDLANNSSPGQALLAAKPRGGKDVCAPANAPPTPMSPTSIAPSGGNQPHPNLQPYLAVNFVIALQGIFPSRA